MGGHNEANRSGRTLLYVRGYSLNKNFGILDLLGQEGHLRILCTYCVKRHLPQGHEVTYSDGVSKKYATFAEVVFMQNVRVAIWRPCGILLRLLVL
jgi:uncharacterized protein YdiU (UPF0061 family)